MELTLTLILWSLFLSYPPTSISPTDFSVLLNSKPKILFSLIGLIMNSWRRLLCTNSEPYRLVATHKVFLADITVIKSSPWNSHSYIENGQKVTSLATFEEWCNITNTILSFIFFQFLSKLIQHCRLFYKLMIQYLMVFFTYRETPLNRLRCLSTLDKLFPLISKFIDRRLLFKSIHVSVIATMSNFSALADPPNKLFFCHEVLASL